MGSLHAMEYSNAVNEGVISLKVALAEHLRINHYPPVPLSMIQPCIRAIEKVNAGRGSAGVRLPQGVTWRGKKIAPAIAIVTGHHLESFLEQDDTWE